MENLTKSLAAPATAKQSTRRDEGLRFLEALFLSAPEGLVEVRHLSGRQEWFAVAALDDAAEYIAREPVKPGSRFD